MNSVTLEDQQTVLAGLATEFSDDDLPGTSDSADLQLQILDLENKLGSICANPTLKVHAIQNARKHQDEFTRRGSQDSNLDENLQTPEERNKEDLLIRLNKAEKKRKAELNKLEKNFLDLESIVDDIRAFGPINVPEEPLSATRKHELQKENVRLANILTVISASRHLDSRRQKKIEQLCEMVHTKNYELEAPDPDV